MRNPLRAFLVVIATIVLMFSSLLLSSLELSHLCHFEQAAQSSPNADTRVQEIAKNTAPFHKHHACYLNSSLTFAISTLVSFAPVLSAGDSFLSGDISALNTFRLFIHFRAPPVRV